MYRKIACGAFGALALVSTSVQAIERADRPSSRASTLGGQGNLVAIGAALLAVIGIIVVLDDDDDPLSV